MTAVESGSKQLERLLAQIAAARDQAAFEELYAATKGKLFATALLIVKQRNLAEEILQDAYVRVWLNAGSYRPSSGSPMTWMIAIARHLAIDMVRRPVREICSDESVLQALPSEFPTAVEVIEAAEDHQTAKEQQLKVLSALQTVDPVRRDLVVAAYIYGESREQLSKRTGVPVNTVKTWIRRTLLEVEKILRNTENRRDIAANKTPLGKPINNPEPMAALESKAARTAVASCALV